MSTTATRLITLIMLLQKQPNQKAADLAARLGVSVRTLHRYFGMLEELGIPLYSERGPAGGFSLVRGFRMPPLVFTPEEAVSVYLGVSLVEEMWGELYRQAAQGVLAKLDNLLPDEQRQEVAWATRSLFATGMHRSDIQDLAPTLEKLRRAVREHHQVQFTYQSSAHPQALPRRVDPYALVHQWGWWYLVGYCHLRNEQRTFRLDRMQSLILSEKTFAPPTDFDLRSYLQETVQAAPALAVKLRFSPAGADVAQKNRASWEQLEEQPDGSLVVSLRAPNPIWAASTALAYGPLVEVLEPPEVRQMVIAQAQALLAHYPHNETAREHPVEVILERKIEHENT